jgi:hypothetical protein
MSLNMDIGAGVAVTDFGVAEPEAESAAPAPLWLQDLIAVVSAAFGVVVSSLIAVLLYLA